MPKPTIQKITAADGSTLTVVTKITPDGCLSVAVYRDKRAPALMVGEFVATGAR